MSGFPEANSAEQAGVRVDEFALRAEVDCEFGGVAATDVQRIEKEQCVKSIDCLGDTTVPLLGTDLFASRVAYVLVVCEAVVERVM